MRLRVLLILVCLLAVGQGCGGGVPGTTISGINPAAPPSPPSELPAFLTLPSDLSIGLGKLQPTPSPSMSAGLKAAVSAGGEFSNDVNDMVDTVQFFSEALGGLLNPYSQLRIPVGRNIHRFQGLSLVQVGGGLSLLEIQMDFGDFDIDGDGVTEGCKGNTAELPICMRSWVDGAKQIGAVFTAYPTETNPGAGRIMGLNVTQAVFLFPKGYLLGINYDHQDPSTGRATDYMVRENPGASEYLAFHLKLDQEGEESIALKTINFSFERLEGGSIYGVQAVARWKEDRDFLSATRLQDPPDPYQPDWTNQCIQISTGDGALQSECQIAGVDVELIPIVLLPDVTDVFIPPDEPPGNFPPVPTF